MLIMDMPGIPPQEIPVLMQAAFVAQKTQKVKPLYGTMGVCMVSPTLAKMGIGTASSHTNGLSLYPQGAALRRLPNVRFDGELQAAAEGAPVEIIQQPKHGVIVAKDGDYNYLPEQGYVGNDKVVFLVNGNDKVVFLVNIDGRIVKAVYYIKVVDTELNSGSFHELYKKYCPKETDWQISSTLPVIVSNYSFDTQQSTNALSAVLTNAGLSHTGFADLAGSALGQTTGTTITLDDNAAGYGWFIDATPDLNEEFLPTADPTVWKAKAGSAAEGKMDMLSVLLHEYGHVVGLDYSADAHSNMAATLQPGVRRTLSADDQLALMQLTGYFPAPDSPSDPFSPFLNQRGSNCFSNRTEGGSQDSRLAAGETR
jgi:hypothetical protein